ncbi:putative lipoprotein, partial [Trichinella spiralis]|uniref:putative lipoprotein n=1 Tax=Trichinella spiralis TaxID=6334 RepID=UPI0001EFDAB6
MGCVLDVCEKGIVEVAASRILTDQVSTLCLPCRTPTVVRTADEPGGQQLQEMQDPRAHPDATVKEKNPTTAPAHNLEAENAASDRAATELAPVGGSLFPRLVRAPRGPSFPGLSKRWPY